MMQFGAVKQNNFARSVIGAAVLAGAMVVGGCSGQPEANAATTEVQENAVSKSGLQIINVTVENGAKKHVFKTELANTPETQARGMMFRTQMGDDEAMIFPFDLPAPRSFWMKNTPLSLDIIFIGPDSTIINIAANAEPYSLDRVLSVEPAIAVLELRGGRAQELGITVGDLVNWPKQSAASPQAQ